MKKSSKRQQDRAAARQAKLQGGKPGLSKYASKGPSHQYEFKKAPAENRRGRG